MNKGSLRRIYFLFLLGMFFMFIIPLVCQQGSLSISNNIGRQAEKEQALLSVALDMQLKVRITSHLFESYCVTGDETYLINFANLLNNMGGTRRREFEDGYSKNRNLYHQVDPDRYGLSEPQRYALQSVIAQINELAIFETSFIEKLRVKYLDVDKDKLPKNVIVPTLSGRDDIIDQQVYKNYIDEKLQIRDSLDSIISDASISASKLRRKNIEFLNLMTIVSQVASIVAFAGLICLSFFLNRKVIRRIVRGSKAILSNIESGDFSAKLDFGNSDEIGDMAQSFNMLTAKLSDNFEFLKTILGSVNEGIIVCTPERLILQINDSAKRLVCYDETPGDKWLEQYLYLVSKGRVIPIEDMFEKVIASGENFSLREDLNMYSEGGKEYKVELEMKPIRNESGGTSSVLISILDVTYQHEQFRKLSAAQRKFELLLDGSMLGMWEYDYHENAFYTEPGFFNMLGREDMGVGPHSPQVISSLCHPDDYEKFIKDIENFRSGSEDHFYIRMSNKAGKWRNICLFCEILDYTEAGERCRLAGFNQDITERIEMERILGETETLHVMTDLAKLGHFTYDINTETYTISNGIRKIFDMPETITTLSLDQTLESSGITNGRSLISNCIEGFEKSEKIGKFIVPYTYNDKKRTLRVQPQIIQNEKGQTTGIWGVVQDITDLEIARREAEEKSTLFRDITENSIFGAYITHKGKFLYSNETFANLIGLKLKDIEGKSISDICTAQTCENIGRIESYNIGEKVSIDSRIEIESLGGVQFIANIYQRPIEYNSQKCTLTLIWDETEKASAEQELKLNQVAMDSSYDEIYVCDEQGNIIYCNEAVTVNTGYKRDELLNMQISQISNLCQDGNFSLKAIPGEDNRFTQTRNDGSNYAVEVNLTNFVSPKGKKLYCIVSRDITEKEINEQKLKKEERKLRLAMDTVNMGYWSYEVEGGKLECDDKVHSIFNIESESLGLDDITTKILAEDRRLFTKQLDSNQSSDSGISIFRANINGQLKHLLSHAFVERSAETDKTEIFGVLQDISEIRMLQEGIEKSEQRLDLAMETARLGTWEWNLETDKIYFSERCLQLLGEERENNHQTINWLKGRIHASDSQKLNLLFSVGGITRSEIFHEEIRIMVDGNWKWMYFTGMVVGSDNPRMVGLFMDITQLKETTKQNLQLQAAIQNSSDEIWIFTPTGQIEFVNESGLRQSNCRDNIYALPIWECCSMFAKQEDFNELSNDILRNKAQTFTNVRCPRNQEKYLDVDFFSFESDSETKLCCMVRDVTERYELEKNLQLMHLAIDNANNGIYIADRNSNIVYFNKTAVNNTGFNSEEMANVKAWTMAQSPSMQNIEDYHTLYESLNPGQSVRRKSYQRKKTGKVVPVEIDIIAFESNDGEKLLAAIVNDISEREAYEARLLDAMQAAEAANKSKSSFIANMSHEIRTPLNAIIGFSQILSLEIQNETQNSYIDSINTAGQVLLSLVNDILDISKIEADKINIIPEATSLSRLINEIEMIFSYKVLQKNLSFKTYVPSDIPLLRLDKKRLNQVLINLTGNAVKFTDEGSIEIGTSFATNELNNTVRLEIWVKDSGIGISEKDQNRIFEEFEQVELSDNRSYEGTGLGLSISKKLIHKMGGNITVESEIGKGSCFRIIIPEVKIEDAEKQIRAKDQQHKLISKGVRVLIIDDN